VSEERLQQRAKELEELANNTLAAAPQHLSAEQVLEGISPDAWEYIEITAVGGPRRIAITKYVGGGIDHDI
jgi:hypothetical protein